MSTKKQEVSDLLSEYVLDNLGTSFKIVLLNSVRSGYNETTGEKEFEIPDYQGLLKKVAVTRAAHSLKLTGGDIRFLRKTLGLKSKDLAEKLDISPEHLSRCENEEKTLSANSEKVLRSLVLMEPAYVLRKALEDVADQEKKDEIADQALELICRLQDVISEMKINPVHPADEEIVIEFRRVPRKIHISNAANDATTPDEEEWRSPEDRNAA